jgi:CDP-diacylglycerol--glycerol-3-phosphate 3-phosphatidyltransferase
MTLIPSPVRRGFEAMLTPLVERLISARVNPNAITSVSTAILVGSGIAFGYGQVRIGGLLLLLSGVGDMLDGRVARGGNVESRFGAFYDSTLDRIGESALYGGIAVYFVTGGVVPTWQVPALVVTLIALAAGLIVSYARARAEGLGLECKVGVAQRAERILGLGVPTLFFGAGSDGWLLLAVVGILAALAVITVVQRIVHVRRSTRSAHRPTQARWVSPSISDTPRAEMSMTKGRGSD